SAVAGLEVFVTQLQPDRPADVALALEILGEPHAQAGEDARELLAVAHRVEIVLERRLAADGFRVRPPDPVSPVRRLVHPGAIAPAEMRDEQRRVGLRELADGADADRLEPRAGLGPDAVDLAHRQRPDARWDVLLAQHRQPAGLLQLGSDFAQQLVRRDADGAREPGRLAHRALDVPRGHPR